MQLNNISSLIQVSILIGLGTTATTFIGGMVYPNHADWRDFALINALGTAISTHYAVKNNIF